MGVMVHPTIYLPRTLQEVTSWIESLTMDTLWVSGCKKIHGKATSHQCRVMSHGSSENSVMTQCLLRTQSHLFLSLPIIVCCFIAAYINFVMHDYRGRQEFTTLQESEVMLSYSTSHNSSSSAMASVWVHAYTGHTLSHPVSLHNNYCRCISAVWA